MEITAISATNVSTESWGEFVEFPLVTVMSKYDEYNNAEGDNPQARRKWMGPVGDVVVEIETDAGITGVGHGNWATGAIATIVDETLSKLVVGEDPREREKLWDMMYRATIPFGRKGAAIEAISAVDLALWDIAGKEADKPVYELLGGPVNDEIPCYASNLHPVDHETLAEEAIDYAEQGFDAMKLRFRYGPEAGRKGMEENERIVETVRDAVGDELEIAGDAYMGWSVKYATKMVQRLEPYDMAWVEEPVIPDDIDGYAEVREAAPMPISGGEHEFTRWGHKQLLEREAVDILQPDIHRCGGLTELQKIDAMASAHDVPVIPHTGTNPHLHFIAASTNAPMAEYFPIPEWYTERQAEQDKDSTYADAIYANPPQAEDGTLSLPDGVGLSAELNREALDHFAVE
ncbi:enolase C-terminal domain-like protein [Natrialba asiatica]|uniref:gluconate dehydratase n=1 Tax=Natrialba asiatica (strain ATCC 700177 / DSM 12278 / JCM 9576 / FERM P-10747 / NBRC 102637 / 172P1) TaxID=29540 RepID=M0B6S9_NATA1|nr:enolase C-terminal domain-like protein [Natrialba asiatica]ELZ05968.1 mandelate racemase/muconate lactonizing protein [Natrialba asiatica DSM 12278]